jgi:hypothetical protein
VATIIVYALIAIAVAAAIVALLVMVLPDERIGGPVRDVVPLGLPTGAPVGTEDINRLRLPVALRGYRMVDTDAVLDRLGAEIEQRDREIAALRGAQQAAEAAEHLTAYAPSGPPPFAHEPVALDDDAPELAPELDDGPPLLPR